MNYFSLFNLAVDFELDLSTLSETYQTLQKHVHPDKFAHESSQQQLLAVQKSSQINDGYQVLKDPIQRAEHLLTLRGTELPNEQSTFGDTSFLMHQMELREMLAELKFADDVDTAFDEASETLDSEYLALFDSLRSQLSANTEQDNEQAAQTLRKLKFYRKLQIELERIEEQLFDD